jgi:hypothetical protein
MLYQLSDFENKKGRRNAAKSQSMNVPAKEKLRGLTRSFKCGWVTIEAIPTAPTIKYQRLGSAATCHFGRARRGIWRRPRCLKLLEQAFYLLQSFFQLVADIPDAARINLHLRSSR